MTDPADMNGAALGDAVMRAMGWIEGSPDPDCWCHPEHQHTPLAPLDFTGPGKWAAFGVVLAECERRDIHLELDMPAGYLKLGDLRLHEGEGGYELGSEAVHGADDIPRALAVAFLRAVAMKEGES